MRLITCFGVLVFYLVGIFLNLPQALAHHPTASCCQTSSASRQTAFLMTSKVSSKPASRFFFTYDFSQLDGDTGWMHQVILGGEWAVNAKWSLMSGVPVLFLDQKNRAAEQGVGDLYFQGRYLLWDHSRTFSYVSTLLSMPTGKEDLGLGRGAVTHSADYFIGGRFKEWTLYGLAGLNYGWEDDPAPVVTLQAGVNSPFFFNKQVYAGMSLMSQIFLASPVFETGSSKTYLQSDINWLLGKARRVTLTLAGRVSLVDTLSAKASLASNSQALMSDVLYGISFGFNYNFK